jgi:hypothetical protein
MFAKLTFWLIWLFIFIPVLAWILGFILPTKTKDGSATGKDSSDTGSQTPAVSPAEAGATDAAHQPVTNPTP